MDNVVLLPHCQRHPRNPPGHGPAGDGQPGRLERTGQLIQPPDSRTASFFSLQTLHMTMKHNLIGGQWMRRPHGTRTPTRPTRAT